MKHTGTVKRLSREEVNQVQKFGRDLLIVAAGHVVAYMIIFWTHLAP